GPPRIGRVKACDAVPLVSGPLRTGREAAMPAFHGKVLRGTQAVADDVYGTLWTRPDGTWGGAAVLLVGQPVDAGESYRLEMEDGRSAEVVVTGAQVLGQSVLVSFDGVGSPP